jgi:hypothetical protein
VNAARSLALQVAFKAPYNFPQEARRVNEPVRDDMGEAVSH